MADSIIRNSVILGREFCKINCLSIDLSNRRISKSFNSANVDIYLDDQHNLKACVQEGFGVYAMADVNLKKGYHKVPVKLDDDAMKIPSLNFGNLYFESQCQNKKIEGLDGVLESAAINKNILIRIKPDENLTTYRIRKGEKLGSIYTIVEFDETDEKESEWNIEKLKGKIKIGEEITEDNKTKIYEMLMKTKAALSENEMDIGMANVTPHKIILTDRTPIWQNPRRFAGTG